MSHTAASAAAAAAPMSSVSPKSILKGSDKWLKEELAKRHLSTTGSKTAHKARLKKAIVLAGSSKTAVCSKQFRFREDYSDLPKKMMLEGPRAGGSSWPWDRSIETPDAPTGVAEFFVGKVALTNAKFRGYEGARDGEICVILKDADPVGSEGRGTYAERVKRVQTTGWPICLGSAHASGVASAARFRGGAKIEICDVAFAQTMFEELPGVVVLSTEDDGKEGTFIVAHPDYVRDGTYQLREKLVFWLRWNEWKKFEAFVVSQTDLENYPTEWDSAYGLYWRAVNGKELRFDEVYEVDKAVDAKLRKAKSNNGKLTKHAKDGRMADC